ncbi:hypothetical protein AC1031_019405 [Aphanomyces cochlioides]|nr:hypothetical protein AC1031_019405 [Aphanomyces cochlioides]
MHHSNDRIAREYAKTPRPPPFRLGMTRLAQHDDEVFNSWRDQDEFAAVEFFPVQPILPDPARRPDFAKVARLANQLKRGISDTLPFPDLVVVAWDLLFTFRSMVMSQVQWQDYREALRRRDEEASQGRRGPTSTQPSQSHPTCAPVNPMIDETAVEYARVWVLKLAYREGRQRAHILGNFYNTLQDIVSFANWRLRGPRIHYSVVADLVRRRAKRANGDFVAAGGGWDRSHGYEQPADFPSQDGILKRVVPVPVRLQDGKVQILGLLRGVTELKSARCRNATRPVPSPRQRRLNNRNSRIFTPRMPEPQGEPTNAARVDHAVN